MDEAQTDTTAEDHQGHDHEHDHDHEAPPAGMNPPEVADDWEAPPAPVFVDPDAATPSEDTVKEALKAVVDPELGMNIVDLGLVYEVDIAEEGDVHVIYSLTTMGCPIGPLIEAQMQEAAAKVPGVRSLQPEIVFRPPWTPEMMSEEAKAALGFF